MINDLLKLLDEKAAQFDFPILGNVNVDLAQTRLSIFKDHTDWLLTIEVVGYFIPGQVYTNDLYAFGNKSKKNGLVFSYEDLISDGINDFPFIDEDGNFILSPLNYMCFKIWDNSICFQPSIEDYKKAGLDIDKFSPTSFIRLLSSLYKEKLWLDDRKIFSALEIRSMPLFFRSDEWDHKDEEPSQHYFFQQIANALEKNDATLISIKNTNTHWSNWGTHIQEEDY